MAAVARFAYDLQNTGTPRLRERLNPCFTHAASSPVLRRFRLDLSATTEHKVNIMAKHFDPSIGQATQFKKGLPSANPGGRPKSRLISEALRVKLAEVKLDDPQGRTYAEVVAASLVETACSRGHSIVAAANEIIDRLEGRARQQIEVADVTKELRERSDADLMFYMEHHRWPEEEETDAPAYKV